MKVTVGAICQIAGLDDAMPFVDARLPDGSPSAGVRVDDRCDEVGDHHTVAEPGSGSRGCTWFARFVTKSASRPCIGWHRSASGINRLDQEPVAVEVQRIEHREEPRRTERSAGGSVPFAAAARTSSC